MVLLHSRRMGNVESLEECTVPIETADASDELSVTTKPFDLSLLLDSAKLQQSLGTSRYAAYHETKSFIIRPRQ